MQKLKKCGPVSYLFGCTSKSLSSNKKLRKSFFYTESFQSSSTIRSSGFSYKFQIIETSKNSFTANWQVYVEFPFIFLVWKWLAKYTGLSERNLKFCQLPQKTTKCLRENVRKLYNICSSFLCRNNLYSETEQNNVNLSYYFGVIEEIMWYSDSEQPVL